MPMNKKWMPYTEDLGEMLNDSRAWCIAGDFTNLKIFNFDTYSCEEEDNTSVIVGIQESNDNVVVESQAGAHPSSANDAQVLHRVCGIIDMILASVPSIDASLAPIKVLFTDTESHTTFQDCAAVHDRKFTFSCFDCANDACYVNDTAFHALVAYCIANPLPLSAAARAAASTPTSSTPNHSMAGAAGSAFVCPYSVAQCEASGPEFDTQHQIELCHCKEGVPLNLIAPLRHFVESVGRGEWPKAGQGQAPAKCCKPCDKLGLTSALKAVESTYVPLVYEPLCDVATVVYSTRCPCCPDVTYMVDKVVNMINRNRSRRPGESECEPMWADLHSPCHSTVSAMATISTTSHPNSPIAISGKRPSFNEYTFEEADEHRASSLPLSSSVGSRPPMCPNDYPCLEGGLVSTRMRVVLCNIDENDLGSADWPTEPCDQIVPHIRFYPACDLAEYSPLRPISRIRNGVLPLGLPAGAIPTPPTSLPMSSREYYQFLRAYDAAKAASADGLSSKGQQEPAASPLSASYFQDKKNYIFGLSCEDRTAENVAKFFLSHAKRTVVSDHNVRKILEECRVIDAPKKRSRSDANMMVLSPSGNALEEIGR